MEFVKRVSHSSFFATGAGRRKLRRLAVCALLAAAMAAARYQIFARLPNPLSPARPARYITPTIRASD